MLGINIKILVVKFIIFLVIMFFVIIIIPLGVLFFSNKMDMPNKIINEKENTTEKEINYEVSVYFHEKDEVKTLDLEEYVISVVAGEIHPDFGDEAIKAQAVATRTYTYGRLIGKYTAKTPHVKGAQICTDFKHCQTYLSKEDAREKWGEKFNTYWSKIEKLVNDTRGELILYDNEIINPLYHSNSSGMTESASEVWEGVVVPYLTSVISYGDENAKSYYNENIMSIKEFLNTLNDNLDDKSINRNELSIDGISYIRNESGRVKEILINDISIDGTKFRKIFSLNSTNFYIEKIDKDEIIIKTYGNGHGVGMSQVGANFFAERGYEYRNILSHYYKGVEIKKVY